MLESKLLSKTLDDKNFSPIYRGNLTIEDFYNQGGAFKFIGDYVKKYGETPDYRTVVAECENFEYIPEVYDHYNYLTKSLKNATAKRKAFTLLQEEAGEKFNKLQGAEFVKWLAEESQKIQELIETDSGLGTNFAINGKERKETYLDRKENRTYSYIPTPYPTLTEWLGGGFELGDYVLLMAYTNRGKSFVASQVGVISWSSGFGVMHYSPELSKSQQLDRLDTLYGHYNNTQLKLGELDNEQNYFNYLDKFNEKNDVPYIVKTMGDLPKGLSLEVIEADLQANPNLKMVIIDGFNLMTHKGNSKDGNRNAMSNTSRKLRQLFGKYGVVGLVVHQTPTSAEKENSGKDDLGNRIVTPPEIYQYSETVAVIQDACTILTFDQFQGVGKMKLAKSRTPNVGKELELHCDFNNGFVKETSIYDFM